MKINPLNVLIIAGLALILITFTLESIYEIISIPRDRFNTSPCGTEILAGRCLLGEERRGVSEKELEKIANDYIEIAGVVFFIEKNSSKTVETNGNPTLKITVKRVMHRDSKSCQEWVDRTGIDYRKNK